MAKVQFNCRLDESTVAKIQEAAEEATAVLGVKVSQAAVLERLPTFSIERLKQMTGPCVYAWRRGEHYLYVGSTRAGLRRPFERSHEVLGKSELQDDDALDVWLCDSEEQARQVEREMISSLRPEFNRPPGEGRELGNRVVVLLSDEEFQDVKGRAGLVPLSAWFRALAFSGKKPNRQVAHVEKLRASDPMAADRPEIEYGSEELPSGGSVGAYRRGPRQKGDKTR